MKNSKPKGGETDDTDVDLMLRFQKGDESAFVELVTRHRKSVLNLVYRYIGDAVGAEDLAQEAFLKVYRAKSSYKPSAKFTTWLYRVVVNMCLNEIRNRRRVVVGTPPGEVVGDKDGTSVLSVQSRKEMQEIVKNAVTALPENQRMAVILVKYEGLSYEDASHTMGMKVEALKSLLFRAKEGLKQKLERYVKQ